MGYYEWSSNTGAMRALARDHQAADIKAKMAAQIAGGCVAVAELEPRYVLTTDFPNYSTTDS